VLDPLDGTSNFAAGIPCFSVSLALLRQGRCALGLVYDPLRDECFRAVRGGGAFLNGARLGPRDTARSLDRAIAAVDFKRLPPDLAAHLAARPPYASQRSFGSVALDWCWVAAGRFHIYLHGKQFLWDYAAGHLILDEAGGRSSTLAGGEVFALSVDPSSAVAGLSPALFEQWFAWLQADGGPIA
jgi:myo-inositol-1(or 4)-monophosphatase